MCSVWIYLGYGCSGNINNMEEARVITHDDNDFS